MIFLSLGTFSLLNYKGRGKGSRGMKAWPVQEYPLQTWGHYITVDPNPGAGNARLNKKHIKGWAYDQKKGA